MWVAAFSSVKPD